MAYATAADILARHQTVRMAEASNEKNPLKVHRKRLTVAAEDASAEIDSYLIKVYPLPLASPPPVLKRLAVDIAVYRLQSFLPKESVEDARRRYEDAIRWFEALVAGELALEGMEESGGTGGVSYVSKARVFDDDALKGFL
jgi:phage gp36-like protein